MHLTIRSGATATVFIDRRLSSIDDYSAVYNLSVRNLNKKKLLWQSGMKVKYVTTIPLSHHAVPKFDVSFPYKLLKIVAARR